MQIVENSYTTLRAIGKDEQWLHKWITEKPSRLGLGDLIFKNSELVHYKNKATSRLASLSGCAGYLLRNRSNAW